VGGSCQPREDPFPGQGCGEENNECVGSTVATTSTLYLSIDEDQIGDKERKHTTAQVGYVVFEKPLVSPHP